MGEIAEPFQRYLGSSAPAAKALKHIGETLEHNGWRAVVFGGAVRDAFLHGEGVTPRDIDIVVDCSSSRALGDALGVSAFNGFGGIRKVVDGMAFDIWPLAATWGIKHLRIDRPTFDDLMRTVFLSTDAVALELGTFEEYDGGFLRSMQDRVVEVVLEANPFPPLCVVCAANTAKKYDLRIGSKLRQWLLSFDIMGHLRNVERAHEAKYRGDGRPFDPDFYRQFAEDLE